MIYEEVELYAKELKNSKGLHPNGFTVKGTGKYLHEQDMMFKHPDSWYTPFHWLAYDNDALSVDYLLTKLDHESIEDMIFM